MAASQGPAVTHSVSCAKGLITPRGARLFVDYTVSSSGAATPVASRGTSLRTALVERRNEFNTISTTTTEERSAAPVSTAVNKDTKRGTALTGPLRPMERAVEPLGQGCQALWWWSPLRRLLWLKKLTLSWSVDVKSGLWTRIRRSS